MFSTKSRSLANLLMLVLSIAMACTAFCMSPKTVSGQSNGFELEPAEEVLFFYIIGRGIAKCSELTELYERASASQKDQIKEVLVTELRMLDLVLKLVDASQTSYSLPTSEMEEITTPLYEDLSEETVKPEEVRKDTKRLVELHLDWFGDVDISKEFSASIGSILGLYVTSIIRESNYLKDQPNPAEPSFNELAGSLTQIADRLHYRDLLPTLCQSLIELDNLIMSAISQENLQSIYDTAKAIDNLVINKASGMISRINPT